MDMSPPAKTLFGAWYTYRLSGQNTSAGFSQRWFTFQANDYVVGSRFAKGVPIYSPNGGKFDDPTAVINEQVGTADITFSSCNAMSLAYTFTQGEFIGQSGTIAMTAAGPVPKGCQY